MELSKDSLITLYQVRRLYEDFDDTAGISKEEYIKLVDDVLGWSTRLRLKTESEDKLTQIDSILQSAKFRNKRQRNKAIRMQAMAKQYVNSMESRGYYENMLNASLAKLAQYRKSRSTTLLDVFDTSLVEVYSELHYLDQLQRNPNNVKVIKINYAG